NLKVDVHAQDGRLELSPLSASLYQGNLSGSATITAGTSPRVALKQTLSDVALGLLLKDALGKEPIDGRGNVTLDVTGQGATVSALRKALAGIARFEVRDGAVHGINVAQA